MTPVGHTLTGLAIGILATPREWPARRQVAALPAFALLANAPDFPIPYWGHHRYLISHSVFSTCVGVVLLAGIVRLYAGGRIPWHLYVGEALAWYSHLLLDSFYNHGRGIRVYWPFGDGRWRLPIPWFSIMQREPLFGRHNRRVWLIEAVAYGTLLTVTLVASRYFPRRQTHTTRHEG